VESEEKLWEEKSVDLESVAWPLSPSLLNNGASSPSVSEDEDQLYSGELVSLLSSPFLRAPLFAAPAALAAGTGTGEGEGGTAAPTERAEQSMEM
jgi:hypothetical protein